MCVFKHALCLQVMRSDHPSNAMVRNAIPYHSKTSVKQGEIYKYTVHNDVRNNDMPLFVILQLFEVRWQNFWQIA